MTVSYKRVAYGGQVIGVNRLIDGAFDVSFGVPPDDADATTLAAYRQNEHFLRYEAEVAGGAAVLQPDEVEPETPAASILLLLLEDVTDVDETKPILQAMLYLLGGS